MSRQAEQRICLICNAAEAAVDTNVSTSRVAYMIEQEPVQLLVAQLAAVCHCRRHDCFCRGAHERRQDGVHLGAPWHFIEDEHAHPSCHQIGCMTIDLGFSTCWHQGCSCFTALVQFDDRSCMHRLIHSLTVKHICIMIILLCKGGGAFHAVGRRVYEELLETFCGFSCWLQ